MSNLGSQTVNKSKAHHEMAHLRYMPALDGIRAFSVTAVVLFHAGVPYASGLYMGVDGFFVLSGYLITSLILSDRARHGSISFTSFYARRARRLFPALFVLIAVVLVSYYLFGDPAELGSIRGDALAALFYVSNWYYIFTHSNYFGQSQAPSPLQHTWSLAIEEQFYLIWPLIIYLVFKFHRSEKALLKIAGIGAIASATAMFFIYSSGSVSSLNQAYYGTECRAQALLVGCFLAVLMRNFPALIEKLKPLWVYGGPVALVLIGLLWENAGGPAAFMFKGGFFVSDILVAIVIASGVVATNAFTARFLSLKPLVALGKISYGVYLWMYPIIEVINQQRAGLSGLKLFIVRAGSILLVATASYFLIEKPIRTGHILRPKLSWFLTPCVVMLVGATAIFVGQKTPSYNSLVIYKKTTTLKTSGPPIRVFLAGDSVAVTLGVGLSEQDLNYGVKVYDEATIGCGVMVSGEVLYNEVWQYPGGSPDYCKKQLDKYSQELYLIKPDVVVVLVGRWEVADRNFGSGPEHIGEPDFDKRLQNDLYNFIRLMHLTGAPVVLLTTPFFEQLDGPNGAPLPEDNPERVILFNSMLKQAAKTLGNWVYVIDLNKKVDPNGTFQEYIDGVQIRTTDGIHFTYPTLSQFSPTFPSAGLWLSPWLLPKLYAIGVNYRDSRSGH
jgi:peptidoglycan/LPS O-acetylase OafA/YrhL